MATLGSVKGQAPDLTPRDDAKKMVSEILKRVDALIRKGELDHAERFVTEAREIDPKNIYAFAFEERIQNLKRQAQEDSIAAAVCHASEEKRRQEEKQKQQNTAAAMRSPGGPPSSSPVRTPQNPPVQRVIAPAGTPARPAVPPQAAPTHVQVAQNGSVAPRIENRKEASVQPTPSGHSEDDQEQKIQRMIKVAVEAMRKEVEQKQAELRARELEEARRKEEHRVAAAAEAARRAEEERQTEMRKRSEEQLIQKIREEYRQKFQEKQVSPSSAPLSTPIIGQKSEERHKEPDNLPADTERQETLSRYKLVLSSIWSDGAIRPEEEATLKELRQSFSISDEVHSQLEKEVKRDAYIEAFKKAWNAGNITPENASFLAELRNRFQISDDEQLKIESTLLWEIQSSKKRPTLLVVDDDERLLSIVSQTLNDAGFITRSVTTSDEAYAYLREFSPDLILCDVNLETSTMGGFAFYEKIRELDQLRETPFIFLSGLADEALVRTGKELGVDDYLSKPVSEETLVATIRGKLRRYQELKKRVN